MEDTTNTVAVSHIALSMALPNGLSSSYKSHRKSQSLITTKIESIMNLPYHKIKKVTCLGSGFVGGPTSAVMALKSDVEVTVVDISSERIAAWNSMVLPIYEPDLDSIVYTARDGSTPPGGHIPGQENRLSSLGVDIMQTFRQPTLFFSTDIEKAIDEADLILVCVNTPTKSDGVGKGAGADLSFVEAATRTIARVSTRSKIIVEKSTVPCRTARSIREIVSDIFVLARVFLADQTTSYQQMLKSAYILMCFQTRNFLRKAQQSKTSFFRIE